MARKLEGILASREPKVKHREDLIFQVAEEEEEQGRNFDRGVRGWHQVSACRCYLCGGVGHLARECRTHPSCDNCGKVGHLARQCNYGQAGSDYNGRIWEGKLTVEEGCLVTMYVVLLAISRAMHLTSARLWCVLGADGKDIGVLIVKCLEICPDENLLKIR